MKNLSYFIAIALLLSCDKSNDDVVKQPSRKGSVEVKITTQHKNGFDILSTEYLIWANNILHKKIIKQDTIPSLGTSLEEAEDEDGNSTMLSVPKDYEFYITVK